MIFVKSADLKYRLMSPGKWKLSKQVVKNIGTWAPLSKIIDSSETTSWSRRYR